jgi:hypothetical protein
MAKAGVLGKVESVFFRKSVCRIVRVGRRAGQGVAIVQPAQQVAVLAALRAERGVALAARLSADRAGGASRTG